MRRTLISSKGFTAPRSSTSLTAEAATLTRPSSSGRQSAVTAATHETPQKKMSVAGAVKQRLTSASQSRQSDRHAEALPNAHERRSAGKKGNRKRARSILAKDSSQASLLAEGSPSACSSLHASQSTDTATTAHIASQTDGEAQGQSAKTKEKKKKSDKTETGMSEMDDEEADLVVARSRRLHNGDVIAFAAPPPKNLALPGTPRGLHHRPGHGERRQVIYPDPVIPSTSSLCDQQARASSALAESALPTTSSGHVTERRVENEVSVPETYLPHPHEPPFRPAPDVNTPLRAVIYPANGQGRVAEGEISPDIALPSSSQAAAAALGFAFADAIASAASSIAPHSTADGNSPSDNTTTHVSATSPSPHTQGPSCASATNLTTEVRLSGGDGALEVGTVEASLPSSSASSLSVSTAIAVHQQAFLRAMLDAASDGPTTLSPMSSVSPSLGVGRSDPRAEMESLQHSRVTAPHTTTMSVLTPATSSAEFSPSFHDESSLAAPTPRVIMWEPSAALASTPAPRRRTMISLAKPKLNPTTNTPPSEAATEASAAPKEMARVDEEAEEDTHTRGHTPEGIRQTSAERRHEPFPRHPSADSALLLTDPDEDNHAGYAQGDDNALKTREDEAQDHTTSVENSKSVPAAAADDEEEETRRNQALDREVEEDLRLSEDLPFTPSGFYASTPFTAHRLTQEDDANTTTGDGDARRTTSPADDAFRDERLAKKDAIIGGSPDTRGSQSATSGLERSALCEPVESFPRARVASPRVGMTSKADVPQWASGQAMVITTGNVADTHPHPHLPALFAHAVVAPAAGTGTGSHTRTTFRFAPQASTSAQNEEEPHRDHQRAQPQPQQSPLHAGEKSETHEEASSLTEPSTAAGLTEAFSRDAEASRQSNPSAEHDPAVAASLLLLPLVAYDGPATPITHHTRPALPTSGEEGVSEPTSGLRPKRTLFCFGAPPPARASPAPVSTSMHSPPQSVSPSHASASPRLPDDRHTRNSMSITEPVGAAAAAAATGAATIISAEPTEMFTEDGDSVSVPVPPQGDETQAAMTSTGPGRHQPEPMRDTPTRPSPSSASPTAGTTTDPFYGLPAHVFTLFMRQRRITQFYAWQHEVLTSPDLLHGRHFVYSLPTSGGKTLVAEVALLRCLVNRQQSCFFVLPFVSLAEEKTTALQPLGDALGFRVEGHYGFTGRFPLPAGPTVYVCTIEKANSVLSYLLEEGRALTELGLVVVDELHMLGESRRGATLEVLLSKLLLLRTRQQERQQQHQSTTRADPGGVASPNPEQALVQIVGMSATVPNLNIIARWLDAACYEGTYRPVPLHQYSVFDGMVLRDGERNERNLNGSNEIEQLLELATEVADGSVLVFCASRQQCVDTARGVVRYVQHTTMRHTAAEAMTGTSASAAAAPAGQPGTTPPRGQSPFRGGADAPVSRSVALGAQPPQTAAALQALLNELQSLSYGQADQLCDLVPYGVAYHHGGLLAEERELIEAAYRDRHLRILCCTSTLAAGVNLPARRVIFKSPYTGREFLTKSRYLQMCGRAGRAGMDAYGESFLVLNRRDRQRGLRLMRDPLEPCESQLLEEHSQFVRSLLECISVGLVTSVPDGVAAWGQSLFCGHALGALDMITTADLWRQHGSLWGRVEPPTLTSALDTCEQASDAVPPPSEATSTSAAASLNPITRGIQLLHPDIAPPSKTALTAAEIRAIRAAFATQPQKCLTMLLGAAVEELLMHGFIETTVRETALCLAPNEEDVATGGAALTTTTPQLRLSATPFGTSSVRSCFSVESALLVRKELDEMLHMGLILADDLHLCYFLTPLREIPEDCDWVLFRSILARLSDSRQRIASLIGLDEFYIDQRAMGLAGSKAHIATSEEARRQSFTARRFWVALILADVLAEVPLPDVVARYGVNRGMLQDVMRSAAMFSSSITSFCHAMGWYSLEAVLASFVKRLGFGVKPDIVPLMDIRGVQPSRARALWNAGYKDPARVAAGDPDEMVTRVKESNPPDSKSAKFFTKRSALMVIREASLLLENQIREKRGELKELTARAAL